MKSIIAILVVCMLCLTSAYAAEWAEGRSAAQPYAGVPEVDLTQTMGYIMMYPRTRLPASLFCDVLEMYLPREDIALGEGTLTLYNADGEAVAVAPFTDEEMVELRPLEEEELSGLMWGGGVCVAVHLPVSLALGETYYVLAEEGCFTTADGSIPSVAITSPEAWTPVVNGDYGVSALSYSVAPVVEETEEGEEAEEPAEDEAVELEYKMTPEVGDVIHFDLVLGGDAKYAVIYSENESVDFETTQFSESCHVTGVVSGEELSWGVVFMDGEGDDAQVVDVVALK